MFLLFVLLWFTAAYSEITVWWWASIFLASVLSYLAVRAANRSNEELAQQVKVDILSRQAYWSFKKDVLEESPWVINGCYLPAVFYVVTGIVLSNTFPIIAALMLTSSLFAIWFCRKLKYQLKLQLGVK